MELYRKYRPKRLEDLVGQPNAVRVLQDLVRKNELPHALLLVGPSGCGKTSAARILKGVVGCSDADYNEVNVASSRGIDTIREIASAAPLAPMGGRTRIWVFDECHQWLAPSQNSILKLLEDPPPHAYFFLCTTDPQKLIKTIHTRCTEVRFGSVKPKDLCTLITSVCGKLGGEISEEVRDKIAEQADGSPRKALVILQQVIHLKTEEEQLEAVLKADSKTQAIEIARTLINPRAKWPELKKLLGEVEDEPETVRRLVLGYASKVLLGGGKLAPRAFLVVCAFENNFYDSGKSGLIRACYEVLGPK